MRNHTPHGTQIPPMQFDPLAGLHLIPARNRMEIASAWTAYQKAVREVEAPQDTNALAEREILVHLSIQIALLAAEVETARQTGTLKRVDADELFRMVSNCLLFLKNDRDTWT